MSEWDVAGSIRFRAKKVGKRSAVEQDTDTMMLDIALYAAGKYPQCHFETSSPALNQRLSERLKP
jgi:hypothetical protein